MIKQQCIKNWCSVLVIAMLPLVVMFPCSALTNFIVQQGRQAYDLVIINLGLSFQYLIYSVSVCYVMFVKSFVTRILNFVAFVAPLFYFLIILLLYYSPLYLYRTIPSFGVPLLLAVPYIWKCALLLYHSRKNNSHK